MSLACLAGLASLAILARLAAFWCLVPVMKRAVVKGKGSGVQPGFK